MHVALSGRDPRVPQELLNEPRVRVPGDKTPGGVPECMKPQWPQPSGVACALEAAADGRGIEAAPEP